MSLVNKYQQRERATASEGSSAFAKATADIAEALVEACERAKASEPGERSGAFGAPASEPVGESEGRSPSVKISYSGDS